jgi:HAD superfamily hydrolase (TIGR01549 family)
MSHDIEAIFIDTGNTMRIVEHNVITQRHARQELARLLQSKESPDALCQRLDERYEAYKKWAKESLVQAPESELWTRWMLPELPAARLEPLAGRLTRLWVEQEGRHIPRPYLKSTVEELRRRGYILGIIANAISQTEIPDWLEADGLAPYFQAVILSSKFGRRKPHPSIYQEAARLTGVDPANCAYVGDNPNRDINGAREAGFGMVVILLEQATLKKDPLKGSNMPDAIIGDFDGLLNLFYARD